MSQNHEKFDFYNLILNTPYFILTLEDVNMIKNYEKFNYILNTLNLIPHAWVKIQKNTIFFTEYFILYTSYFILIFEDLNMSKNHE